MKNAVKLGKDLYETYLNYLETNIPLSNASYEEERHKLYEYGSPTSLMQSPIIELINSYKGVNTLDKICDKKTADFLIKGMFKNEVYPLYEHQERSINSAKKQNVIITTGTGSGKTECYLIPIIADLVKESETWQKNGKKDNVIRTLVMYPLNALAEDQLKRMREALDCDEAHTFYKNLGFNFTFGRYTSRTPKTLSDAEKEYADAWRGLDGTNKDLEFMFPRDKKKCSAEDPRAELISRDVMIGKVAGKPATPPDILITNYSMLAVMLMRKKENVLFEKTKEWIEADKSHKFTIVIDELHTYRGTAGTEVSYILKNLLYRLGLNKRPEQIRFIASSASMGDGSDVSIKRRNEFISDFFGIPLDKVDEKFDVILDPKIEVKEDTPFNSSAISELKDFDINRDKITREKALDFVNKYNVVNKLRWASLNVDGNYQASSVEVITRKLLPENQDLAEILLLTINEAMISDKKAIQPMRAHYFFKNISNLWICSNPECTEAPKDTSRKFGKLYASPKLRCNCGAKILEALICRQCGELFLAGYPGEPNRRHEVDLNLDPQTVSTDERLQVIYSSDEDLLEKDFEDKGWHTIEYKGDGKIKASPGTSKYLANTLRSENIENVQKVSFPIYCPRCGFEARFDKDKPTLTPITRHSTYVQKVNQVFADKLMEIQKDEPKQKLVLFSDSRQSAAKLSSGIELDHYHDMLRIAIYKALSKSGKGEITELFNMDKTSPDFFALFAKLNTSSLDPTTCDILNKIFSYKMIPGNEGLLPEIEAFIGNQNVPLDSIIQDVESIMISAGINPAGPDPTINFKTDNGNNFDWRQHIDWEKRCLKYVNIDSFDNETRSIDNKCRAEILTTIFGNSKRSFESLGLGYITVKDFAGTEESDFYDACLRLFGENFRIYDPEKQPHYYDKNKENHGLFMKLRRYNNKVNREWGGEARTPKLIAMRDAFRDKSIFRIYPDSQYITYLDGTCSGLEFKKPSENSEVYICSKCRTAHLHWSKGICTFCLNPLGKDDAILYKDFKQNHKFYTRNLEEDITRLHCEELTGQTDLSDSLKRQRLFQDETVTGERKESDPIDLLSVTTTMEAGVDIGSLSAVMLGNVPPQRFNYQQRVGRAGRRGAPLSIALTVAKSNSHDLAHFNKPERAVSGNPPSPYIDLMSKEILERVIIQEVLRLAFLYVAKEDDGFDGGDNVHGQFGYVSMWKNNQIYVEDYINKNLDFIKSDIIPVFTSDPIMQNAIFNELFSTEDGCLKIINKINTKLEDTNFIQSELSERLAAAGLLPMFGFPTQVRMLYQGTPESTNLSKAKGIDRPQDMALGTFAPGSENVKDKKIFKSVGFAHYYVFGKEVKAGSGLGEKLTGDLFLCDYCGYTTVNNKPEKITKCPICNQEKDLNKFRIENLYSPKGYYTDDYWTDNYNGRYDYQPVMVESKLDCGETEISLSNLDNTNILLGSNVVPEQGVVRTINTNNGKGFTVDYSTTKDDRTLYEVNAIGTFTEKKDQRTGETKVEYDSGPIKLKFFNKDTRRALPQFTNIALISTKVTGVLECCIKNNNPDVDIDFVNNVQNKNPFNKQKIRDIRSAFISWGYLLRKSITDFLDINDSELNLDFFVTKDKQPGVYMMEQLVNGAGYTSYIANSNGKGLDSTSQRKVLCDNLLDEKNPDSIYSFLNRNTHKENCECSCYDCLRDYYNQRQHSSINWRLGVDLAKLASKNETPNYFGENNYWNKIILDRISALEKVEKMKKGGSVSVSADVKDDAILLVYGTEIYVLYHPLWSIEKISSLSEKYNTEKALNIIDFIQTLQLSRKINPFEKPKDTDSTPSDAPIVEPHKAEVCDFKITDEGTNLKEYSNTKIWADAQLGNCSDLTEKALRQECINYAEELNLKEKPFHRCGVQIGSNSDEEIECDLLWKKSHVAYFTAENEDYYEVAKKSDWICFCGNDKDLSVQIILDQLREAL